MGSGVEAQESFEALVEERLNRDFEERALDDDRNPELRGCGILPPAHALPARAQGLRLPAEHGVFLGHVSDLEGTSRRWSRMVRGGTLPSDPFQNDLLRRSGMTPQAGPNEARRRVKPFERELLGWVYRRFVTKCRERGITPVFVYMQKVTEPGEIWSASERGQILALAEDAGFPILDLSGVFHNRGRESLDCRERRASQRARKPSVADKLYELLRARRARARAG